MLLTFACRPRLRTVFLYVPYRAKENYCSLAVVEMHRLLAQHRIEKLNYAFFGPEIAQDLRDGVWTSKCLLKQIGPLLTIDFLRYEFGRLNARPTWDNEEPFGDHQARVREWYKRRRIYVAMNVSSFVWRLDDREIDMGSAGNVQAVVEVRRRQRCVTRTNIYSSNYSIDSFLTPPITTSQLPQILLNIITNDLINLRQRMLRNTSCSRLRQFADPRNAFLAPHHAFRTHIVFLQILTVNGPEPYINHGRPSPFQRNDSRIHRVRDPRSTATAEPARAGRRGFVDSQVDIFQNRILEVENLRSGTPLALAVSYRESAFGLFSPRKE